jgi:hypothetical protein
MPVQQVSTFQQQFQEFMFYAGPIIQIVFWVVVAGSLLYAAIQFKRLVDAHVSEAAALAEMASEMDIEEVSVDEGDATDSSADAGDTKIATEEFTE